MSDFIDVQPEMTAFDVSYIQDGYSDIVDSWEKNRIHLCKNFCNDTNFTKIINLFIELVDLGYRIETCFDYEEKNINVGENTMKISKNVGNRKFTTRLLLEKCMVDENI